MSPLFSTWHHSIRTNGMRGGLLMIPLVVDIVFMSKRAGFSEIVMMTSSVIGLVSYTATAEKKVEKEKY